MSLIGGYLAHRQMKESALRGKLSRYSIGGNTEGSRIVRIAESGPRGHVFAIATEDGIDQPQFLKDGDGNVALSLGYLRPVLNEAFPHGVDADSLMDFEGEFCLICSRLIDRTVHLVNDRFAARPLFIYLGAEIVVFATDLNFLLFFLDTPPPVDRTAWYEIFKYGHTVGTGTTFEGISKLAPATRIVLSDDGASETAYWVLRHEPQRGLELVDSCRQAFSAFRAGLDWRESLVPSTQRRVVPLSGGLDSRLIAGAMSHRDLCTAVTRGGENSRQAQIAAAVAGILGMRHVRLQLQNVALYVLADDLIELTGGMLAIHHPAKTLQRAATVRQESGFAFGGEPGDVLAGSYIPSVRYLNAAKRDAQILRYCENKGIDDRLLRSVFSPDTFAVASRAGAQHLYDSFDAVSGATAAHAVTAWAMRFRQPSFSFLSPYNHLDDIFQIYPHLDYRYNDLLLQLPAEWLYGERFYKAMIFHGLPVLQSVPYANTGELLTGQVQPIGTTESVASWMTDTMRTAIPGIVLDQMRRIRHRSGASEVRGLHDYLRKDAVLISAVREALHSYHDLSEILDLAGTERFIDGCIAGKQANVSAATEILGSIVTLTLWYDKYYS